mmetsp:Transcript_18289/g.42098  ORF Transcript_18289/g.42098 Transcript_18289/m.42098 type:complete len:507 (-) Transcript_18289:43-1563(-)
MSTYQETNEELSSIERSSSPNPTMTVSAELDQLKEKKADSSTSSDDANDIEQEKPKEDSKETGKNTDENTGGISGSGDMSKRFLPAYKKANAALTFPEKMMNLMKYVEEKNKTEKDFCISWLPEGKAFVIYNIKEFTSSVIPKFFKASKFCSFTRKLYRWGFRQLNRGIGPDEPIIFGNEYFQRDNADLMVNMRSITAASIRKRESDLLRHMLASKKRALMSLDGASNAAYQDTKHLNMLLNNNFDQKQQNAALSSAANAMNSQQRFGGNGFPTDLGHLDNHSLQMMYQSLANKSVGSGDGGISPILSDAVSQMNNSSPYNSINGGAQSHPQDFNPMSSMQMSNNSSNIMGGPTSNYISHMNSGMPENGGNGRMNNMNGARMNGMSANARMNGMNGNFNNSGYNGSLNNNIFPSDSMYGSGSTNSRGGSGFNLPQQYNTGGADSTSARKNFMNGGKHNFHTNAAENGSFGNYGNMSMNMNINQHLFNLSTPGTTGSADDLYFGGQY